MILPRKYDEHKYYNYKPLCFVTQRMPSSLSVLPIAVTERCLLVLSKFQVALA